MDCDDNNIQNGDKVILMKEKNIQIAQIQKNKKVNMDKQWFNLNGAVGHPYGTTFEAKGNNIHPVIEATDIHVKGEDSDMSRDNRNIKDTSDSQKLSREEIEELRNQSEKGEEVVRQLIENSSTFNEKTEYSKEKYIKKKTKKHVNRFAIVRPCTRLIAEMYYNKGPLRINNLRIDALAQMLTFGDVKGHNRQLVVESCNGLLLAATVERMGGHGTIVQLHSEQDPPRQAMEGYNFTQEHYKMLNNFPLKMLGTLRNTVETPQASDHTGATPNKRARLEDPDANGMDNVNSNNKEDAPVMLSDAMSEATTKEACLEEPGANNMNNVNSHDKGDTPVTLSEAADKDDSSEVTNPSEIPSSTGDECIEVSPTRGEIQMEEKDVPVTDEIKTVSGTIHVEDPSKKAAKAEQEQRKQKRQMQIQAAREILQEGKFDSLLVAVRVHPTPVIVRLLEFLSDSRPVAVFCPYHEPLMDCYQRLRDSGRVVHLRLSETWLRNYQVLPNRTHPEVNMGMNGGYLLTFIKVSDRPAPSSTA